MPTLTINSEQIYYEDIGTGTPILMIHPPGMGRIVFEEQKSLSEHHRLIIPDLIGQGDSSYKGGSEITIKRFSEDLVQLLNHLEITNAAIFGYSSGGTVAQQMCIDHPSMVKALIMCGGFPVVDNFFLVNEHKLGIYTAKNNKRMLSQVLAISHTKNKSLRQKLKEHMYKSNGDVWSKYYLQSLNFNCKRQISSFTKPTLLIYGSLADPINTYSKFYKSTLQQVKIEIIKRSSHRLPTRRSKQVNDLVHNFVQQLK
ncbi:alpha/beta fold hydrolase [Bacillus suaedaesalsae]|uniref:Alpha/beta hydrolase n=1 Tax=Bacillus suaedaesalsae TaxID=2810349 RepID=A0ABS2DLY9_9BACI|nr:alpha/beta hydrolase [Bacillus suaedaesalsae]MBM6619484.1 alpha/beta hydrolase [Bacillus suaedaesalsae]